MLNKGDEVEYREWGDNDLSYPTGNFKRAVIIRKRRDGMYDVSGGLALGESRLTLVCRVEIGMKGE